ncbi:hypothetical protein JCM8097_001330 [Rhodosporidiobolus ruineniae]
METSRQVLLGPYLLSRSLRSSPRSRSSPPSRASHPSPPPSPARMSYDITVPTPVQCETTQITWTGNASDTKTIAVWVQGTRYFAERPVANLTAALGTWEWMCDFPAGAWIAFELYQNPSAAIYATTPFLQVQPGTTDACLRKNEGQLATASMAALASSLSSASPQLFTYAKTTTSSALSSSTSSPPTSTSDLPAPSSSATNSGSSLNAGAVAGGIVGGLAFVLALGAVLFFLCRRRRRASSAGSGSSAVDGAEKSVPGGPSPASGEAAAATAAAAAAAAGAVGGGAGAKKGFFRSVSASPIDAWRSRVQGGRPPSAWTRRSRAFSFGTSAGGGVGGEMRSASVSSPPAQPSTVVPFAQRQAGPREGVPEIVAEADEGEGRRGSHSAYPAGSSSSLPRAAGPTRYSGLPDPSSTPAPTTSPLYPPYPSPPAASADAEMVELLNDGSTRVEGVASPVGRPPTRLTTPGGMTSHPSEGGSEFGGFVEGGRGSGGSYGTYARA